MEDDSKISPNTARENARPSAKDSEGELNNSSEVRLLAEQVRLLTSMVEQLTTQDRDSSSQTASRSSAELHFGGKSPLEHGT